MQKEVVMRCRQMGKPVIVASHLLQSMIEYPTPTRAEARFYPLLQKAPTPVSAICSCLSLLREFIVFSPSSMASASLHSREIAALAYVHAARLNGQLKLHVADPQPTPGRTAHRSQPPSYTLQNRFWQCPAAGTEASDQIFSCLTLSWIATWRRWRTSRTSSGSGRTL